MQLIVGKINVEAHWEIVVYAKCVLDLLIMQLGKYLSLGIIGVKLS